MSVINIEGITRQGCMVQQEKRNERAMILQEFNMKVNKVLSTKDKAKDVLDTVNFMKKNGFRSLYEEWFKNMVFSLNWNSKSECHDGFKYNVPIDSPKESTYIVYKPLEGKIEFHWNGYGMCDGRAHDEDYFISNMRFKAHNYEKGLEQFAAKFEPFLDAFINWANGFA